MTEPPPWPPDPFFVECLLACARNTELVQQFDRLRGTNLQRRGSGLERAIDGATGRLDHDLEAFAEFVRDHIYAPVVAEQ